MLGKQLSYRIWNPRLGEMPLGVRTGVLAQVAANRGDRSLCDQIVVPQETALVFDARIANS